MSHRRRTGNIIIGLALTLSSQVAAGQDIQSTKSNEDNRIDPLGKEFEDKGPKGAPEKFYDFFVATLKRRHVHSDLERKFKEGQVKAADEYGYLFPDLNLEPETNGDEITKDLRDQMVYAAGMQALKQTRVLKDLEKSLSFELNLFGASKSQGPSKSLYSTTRSSHSDAAVERPYRSRRARASSASAATTAAPSAGPHVYAAGLSEATLESDQPTSWKRIGQFKGGLKPRISEEDFASEDSENPSSGFVFSFQQVDSYYILSTPVDPDGKSEGIEHAFALPIYGKLRFSKSVDFQGRPLKTGFRGLTTLRSGPQLDALYVHRRAMYQVNGKWQPNDDAEWLLGIDVPAEVEAEERDFTHGIAEKERTTEYKVEYSHSI